MHLLKLNEAEHTVQVLTQGVKIDLGGIGKGYALDKMADLLRQWGIETALIHSGFSTARALGAPAGIKGWPLTMSNPADLEQTLALIHLDNEGVSGSGLQKGRHIIDPRSGEPVQDKLSAWARAADATTADALSTAFMVMTPAQVERYCSQHPDVKAMTVLRKGDIPAGTETVLHYGDWTEELSVH
jgi:thiamine biosynthesis lipoprotein